MPLSNSAPSNKRKKASKIITDLSHVTQNGKVCSSHTKQTVMHLNMLLNWDPLKKSLFICWDLITCPAEEQIFCICLLSALSACCTKNCVGVNHCKWLCEAMIKHTHTNTLVLSGNRIPNMHVECPGWLWVIIWLQSSHKSVTITGKTNYHMVILCSFYQCEHMCKFHPNQNQMEQKNYSQKS